MARFPCHEKLAKASIAALGDDRGRLDRIPPRAVPSALSHRAPFTASTAEECEMSPVVVAMSSLSSACGNSSAVIRGCRAENLYGAAPRSGLPLGQDDDPLLPTAHLHRSSYLRHLPQSYSSYSGSYAQ